MVDSEFAEENSQMRVQSKGLDNCGFAEPWALILKTKLVLEASFLCRIAPNCAILAQKRADIGTKRGLSQPIFVRKLGSWVLGAQHRGNDVANG
jgi:hypothetical protein